MVYYVCDLVKVNRGMVQWCEIKVMYRVIFLK